MGRRTSIWCTESVWRRRPYFPPRASPQDLQIDPEHPVCFDRSPIPGRKPKPVLERRGANQRVIDGTPGDTSPGKTGEELLGRCSAKEAGRWEVPGQQSLGCLRRAPEGWWQPGDHGEGFECSMPSESDAAIGDRICGRPVMLVIRYDKGDRHTRIDQEVRLVTSDWHPEGPGRGRRRSDSRRQG